MERYGQTLDVLRQMLADWMRTADGRVPPERVLSDQLGVGRRLLRRALAALEQEGVLTRRQGKGTFVVGRASPSGTEAAAATMVDIGSLAQCANPVELVELRLILEPIMARLATLHASQQNVVQLRALARRTREATNHEDYQAADKAFHRRIAELSHNALFLILHDTLSTALRDEAMARFGENGHCFKRQSTHVSFHDAIVDAIAARDSARAEQLMQDHLGDVHQKLFIDAMPAGYRLRRDLAAE
ncbi:MAG: FadR/GntR family transcriptional regulator [Alphaproteobacteria bacterium]